MGGGGVMRAAAKLAGIGVSKGSFRGISGLTPAEYPFTSAARKATHPVSVIVSSSDDVPLNGLVASQNGNIDSSSVQRPCWEIDDWDFAGGEEEMIGEPMPRLVFGGVPTLQEAKQATDELKDALDKAYLSPNSAGFGGSFISSRESGKLLHSNSNYLETKPCVTSETTVISSVPKQAIQAFRFLNESPAAQIVVASIASDPNVWNAVLQNEALVDFLRSHKTGAPYSDEDPNVKESVDDADFQSPESLDESIDSGKSVSRNGFVGFFKNMKLTVFEIMNSLSGYFEYLFGGPMVGEISAEADGSANATIVDPRVVGASFMGLAVMVIMVVVLKRV